MHNTINVIQSNSNKTSYNPNINSNNFATTANTS